MEGPTERSALLGPPPAPRRARGEPVGQGLMVRGTCICVTLLGAGCVGLLTAILLSMHQIQATHNTTVSAGAHARAHTHEFIRKVTVAPAKLRVLSLMAWGSPGSFGTQDKELRVRAIGNLSQLGDWDVFLLSDLWMRPDHAAIREAMPEGWDLTSVGDLSLPSCDGTIAPEFCSGLAVLSRFPIVDVEFTAFRESGDLLWDYEYFLRRGVGRVGVEVAGTAVDLFVTSLASMDYNYWYREHQVKQLLEVVARSTADCLVLGGDLNVDPRDGEDTYKALKGELTDSVEEFYKDDPGKVLDPSLSTLGNPANTYTSKGAHPVIYDYIWYRAAGAGVALADYQVPILTTGGERDVSLSSHEAVSVTLTIG